MNEPEEDVAPEAGAGGAAYEETVAVYSAPDAVTAQIVRGALEAEGIRAVIGEQVADAYAGPLSVGEGYYCEIRVPAEEAEAARALLAAYEAGQGQLTEEDDIAPDESPDA